MKYQITFNYGGTCESYTYFEGGENPEATAAQVATFYIQKQKRNARAFSSVEPPKTLSVAEWDNDKKDKKKGGHTFKLSLRKTAAVLSDGSKEYDEYYEPVKN